MKHASLAVVLALATAGAGHAQTLEDRLRSQLVSVTAQLRELQAQQAAQAGAQDELKAVKAELAAAKAQVRAAKRPPPTPATDARQIDDLKAQVAALTQDKAQANVTLAALRDANARLNTEAMRLQDENQAIKTSLMAGGQALQQCQAKNVQAIQIAKYILAAYDRVTVADVLARKEPVTGLMRPRIEQLEQDYADRIYESRVDVPPKPAAAPQP